MFNLALSSLAMLFLVILCVLVQPLHACCIYIVASVGSEIQKIQLRTMALKEVITCCLQLLILLQVYSFYRYVIIICRFSPCFLSTCVKFACKYVCACMCIYMYVSIKCACDCGTQSGF